MSEPSSRSRFGWLHDFFWRDNRVVVRRTGVAAKPDHRLLVEVLNWLIYFPLLALVGLVARLRRPARVAIWYAPDRPRPWYLLRGVALWAGLSLAGTESQAAVAFYFEDTTRGNPTAASCLRQFNASCTDVSKTHVAQVFEEVFGYPLLVDPTTAAGPIVEKSETNGVHDGAVVTAPLTPREGRVYQHLVDTEADGFNHDLRTPCVNGEPVVVWRKYKTAGQSFSIQNRRARLQAPHEVFSAHELELIRRFNARMGLDWGGLDILRDRSDGRIYIVDVNKTDVGPVIALSWRDKIVSMHRLARALDAMIASEMVPRT